MSEKIKVFIVDDELFCRKILNQFIEAAPDMDVAGETNNGQSAILLIDEVAPDVILLDEQARGLMPLKDIISQLCAIIPDVRIILCLDQKQKEDFSRSKDLQIQSVHDFLVRPFKKEQVYRSIRDTMNRKYP